MMFRYRYFIKPLQGAYRGLHCIRLPVNDPRIQEFTKKYNISWDKTVGYVSQPTLQEEIFQIKMLFRAWDNTVEIESIEEAAKSKRLA